METSSQRGDVSVSMKRGAEKASSLGDHRSREVVTILLSLDWVLMNFRVAEVFCEDRFSDAVVVRGLESGLCVCVCDGRFKRRSRKQQHCCKLNW